MARVNYIRGDATQPQAKGNRIIAHVCNDLGGWGKGFVLAISKRWPEPEAAYRAWFKERSKNDFGLGAIQVVRAEPYVWVANMVAQRGMKTGSNGPPIRYEAARACLKKLAVEAEGLGASVHMPRIGCGLAGGRWEKIEPIILDELTSQGVEVTVYDLGVNCPVAWISRQTCRDARHRDPGRIGITPQPSNLCTGVSKRPATIRSADGRASFGAVPEFVGKEWSFDRGAAEAEAIERPEGGAECPSKC